MRKPPNERLTSQARTPAGRSRPKVNAGGQSKEATGPRLSPGNGRDDFGSPAKAGAQTDSATEPQGGAPNALSGAQRSPIVAPGRSNRAHVPERRCILTGAHDARDALIRLALAPDGAILPDVRAKAPGRGAWIGIDRAALEKALANGKLKGALARAFKSGEVRIPDDLPARIEDALRQALLDRLGLEARAGTLLTGSERIEDKARKGEVRLLLHAEDAGEDGNRKLDQALRVGSEGREKSPRPLVIPAGRAILSLALGRQNVVHIALIDRAAAARVEHALDRWRAFIGANGQAFSSRVASPGDPENAKSREK
jgi:predicted RNA-binding protein YlxR (DUF448 family)